MYQVTKVYPDSGKRVPYTGEVIEVGQGEYVISLGIEGSGMSPIKGNLISSGPYTTRTGIGEWAKDEAERLMSEGGKVSFHSNEATLLAAGLDAIIGDGITFEIRPGMLPHLLDK